MRKLLFGFVLLIAPEAWAQSCNIGQNFTPITFESEKITVSSTSIGFDSAKFAPSGSLPAVVAYCSNETDQIRFLTTGAAPTSTTGVLVPASGSYIMICQADIANFRAIRVTADATLNCVYQR